MVYINDLAKRCKEKGYPMSNFGIYLAGKKNGFLYKNSDDEWELDKEKFSEWLEKCNEEIPEGYLSAKQIVEEFKISLASAYSVLNNSECETKKFGFRRLLCGERESIKRIIEQCGKCGKSKKHKYDWGDEDGND